MACLTMYLWQGTSDTTGMDADGGKKALRSALKCRYWLRSIYLCFARGLVHHSPIPIPLELPSSHVRYFPSSILAHFLRVSLKQPYIYFLALCASSLGLQYPMPTLFITVFVYNRVKLANWK